MLKINILFTCFLLCAKLLFAQQDPFAGTWTMTYVLPTDSSKLYLELQVARPENNLLYPAQMKITSGKFIARYELLLVKKNERQLAIGRHKFVLDEKPFSLGAWTILLNGTFDLNEGPQGHQQLNVTRIPAIKYGFTMPALSGFPDSNRTLAIALNRFLKEVPVAMQKISTIPWRSTHTEYILNTHRSPAYFGIVDTLYTSSETAGLFFSDNFEKDKDTVSVWLNGKAIIRDMDINHPFPEAKIRLDTGLNTLCFFAENYGRKPPNTGKLNIVFNDQKYLLDFTKNENVSATFIVAKIYYYPDGRKENTTQQIRRKTNARLTRQIDSIAAFNPEITLALWDDAVEDGDSISLHINDEIFMPGIAVKKKPQFIKVTLYPGDNKIIFIADNLGSISPNTSILEIIDGKKRRSYMINTNLGENNSIKILYKAGQ